MECSELMANWLPGSALLKAYAKRFKDSVALFVNTISSVLAPRNDATVTLDGADDLDMSVDERAKAGLFLAMQYPVEVPGVSVSNFLRTAATALRGEAPKLRI